MRGGALSARTASPSTQPTVHCTGTLSAQSPILTLYARNPYRLTLSASRSTSTDREPSPLSPETARRAATRARPVLGHEECSAHTLGDRCAGRPRLPSAVLPLLGSASLDGERAGKDKDGGLSTTGAQSPLERDRLSRDGFCQLPKKKPRSRRTRTWNDGCSRRVCPSHLLRRTEGEVGWKSGATLVGRIPSAPASTAPGNSSGQGLARVVSRLLFLCDDSQ